MKRLIPILLLSSLFCHAQQSCSAGTTPIPAWSIRLTSDSVVPLACYSNVTGAISFPNCPSCGGSGTPGGSNKDVQINVSGAFGADTGNFIEETANHRVGVNTSGDSPTLLDGFQYGNGAVLAYFGAFGDANIWTDSNNHHFFAEESQWNPTNAAMGASGFNTAIIIGGPTGDNHFASFQSAPICNTTGTAGCGTLYGFYDSPTIQGTGTGTLNRQGLSVQAVALSGGATLNQNYGVYIAPDTAGNSNWAIVADKVAHSYLAGCLAVHGVVDCTGSSSGLTVNATTNQFNIDNTGSIAFAGGKGQHIKTQASGNDIAGTCTAAAAATCTVTFTTAYASAPSCIVTDQTNITTLKALPSTTTLVITTSAASSDVFSYICIGNPN